MPIVLIFWFHSTSIYYSILKFYREKFVLLEEIPQALSSKQE